MASAVRRLRFLVHAWLHFALCPSGHWPRSAPEICFTAIQNCPNPDSCDLSLPTPTSISHPPSRQNAASPNTRPSWTRERTAPAADFVSRVPAFATSRVLAAPTPVSRILAFSIAVFLAIPEPVSRTSAFSTALFRAAPILFLALPRLRLHSSALPPILFLALPRLRLHTFSRSLFLFGRRIAAAPRAPT